jgi:hypothetical protein
MLHVLGLICIRKGLSLLMGSPRVSVEQTLEALQDHEIGDPQNFVPCNDGGTTFATTLDVPRQNLE